MYDVREFRVAEHNDRMKELQTERPEFIKKIAEIDKSMLQIFRIREELLESMREDQRAD